MESAPSELAFIDIRVTQLIALVSDALARATHALLDNDAATGLGVVDGDQVVDDLTAEVELLVWRQLDQENMTTSVRVGGPFGTLPGWRVAAFISC